jgi:hypothetical protein
MLVETSHLLVPEGSTLSTAMICYMSYGNSEVTCRQVIRSAGKQLLCVTQLQQDPAVLLLLLSTYLSSSSPRRLLMHSNRHYICPIRYVEAQGPDLDCSSRLLAAFVFSHLQQKSCWPVAAAPGLSVACSVLLTVK